MVAELSVIRNHAKGKKHCSFFKDATVRQAPASTFFPKQTSKTTELVARAEIKIAGVLAAHSVSFNLMDHLSDVLKDVFSNPKVAEEFSMKRTKATAIVTNVIGKSYKEELAKKLKETKFSVLSEESTDVGSIKTSYVVVRFFDPDTDCAESKFWELCVKCIIQRTPKMLEWVLLLRIYMRE